MIDVNEIECKVGALVRIGCGDSCVVTADEALALITRLREAEKQALEMAHWLAARTEVKAVLEGGRVDLVIENLGGPWLQHCVNVCGTDGKIMVNGVPITEPYITIPAGESRASAIDFTVTVPEGSLFVMGDNRYNSKDSRYNTDKPGGGFVGLDNVVGRAFVLSWPMSHWGWLSNYPEVFADVPDASLPQ